MKLDINCDDDDNVLSINKDYAERYDNWRYQEELQKLKDKYGDDASSGEESSSSEEPADWSLEKERSFLRTLAALKTRDPMVYKSNECFFSDDASPSISNTSKVEIELKKKKYEPMFLKDYERKLITERVGMLSEDEVDEDHTNEPGYFSEQSRIKRELKEVVGDGSSEEDDEPLLKKREKTELELEKEDDEYYAWLKGQRKEEIADAKHLKGLRDFWEDSNIDEDEKFLRDFLLEKKYEVDSNDEIPAYDEIVNIQEDEEEMQREHNFEYKYNFRYEEPDKDFIKQYPRTVKESLRKLTEKRKQKRDSCKRRKDLEKKRKKDEIRELKMLKKREIEEKLQRLRKLAGDNELPLSIEELEAEFDPAQYDRLMKNLFGESYYEEQGDDEKPVFSEMSDDSSDEADYNSFPISSTIEIEAGSDDQTAASSQKPGEVELFRKKDPSRRKKKRNSRFAEAVLRKKPLFDPNEKTFEEYFNEYYALDYEDIIADNLITKFKYREVPPNSFGLTVDEILTADDRQLNAWASLKKATAYRLEAEERYDIQAYEKKAKNLDKKKRIFSTDFGGKKMKNVEHIKDDNAMCANVDAGMQKRCAPSMQQNLNGTFAKNTVNNGEKTKRKHRKRKNKPKPQANDKNVQISDERLRAYGINPKKFRNKLKYSKNKEVGTDC